MNIRKKIFLIFTLFAFLNAKAGNTLVLHLTDGKTVSVILTSEPVITFSGTQMLISSTDYDSSYEISNIDYYDYNIGTTAIIATIKNRPSIQFKGDRLYVGNVPAKSKVGIFSIDDLVNITSTADDSGVATISLSNCKRGIYILKIEGVTIKFIKR